MTRGAAMATLKSDETEARIVNAVVKYFMSQVVKCTRKDDLEEREDLEQITLAFLIRIATAFIHPLRGGKQYYMS